MYIGIQRIGELSDNGVFIYDMDRQVFKYMNGPFADLFDLSREEIETQPGLLVPFVKTEDEYHLRHNFALLLRNKKITDVEFRIEVGKIIRDLRCDAFVLEEGNLITGFIKDVSREKQHEEYIMNYGAKKDTLLDMLTHNLTGPLALSKNILRWVQQSYTSRTPEQISNDLLLIQENTQHCLDIVNDFLKEEHLESQYIFTRKTRFDLLDRTTATLEKLIAANKNKKFQLITKLDNLNITTDSVKFFQIIHNLVSNSIKFTPDGGEIDIIVEETEETFIVRVKDNGIGIPASLRDRLFDRRTPSRRAEAGQTLSSGLGLSIVKTLVELLGGSISLETVENAGSIFTVEFPKD